MSKPSYCGVGKDFLDEILISLTRKDKKETSDFIKI